MKRSRLQRHSLEKHTCLFCEEETGNLHEFRTLDADINIRIMPTDLQDAALVRKLEGGDLIALEAKYHLACLAKINRHRSLMKKSSCNHNEEKKNMPGLSCAGYLHIKCCIRWHLLI